MTPIPATPRNATTWPRRPRRSSTTASPKRAYATEDLPYYATTQAVEDLEAIRQYLGVEQFVLYGESYGTQYVQTYAAAHPDNVSMLILDGVVDLTVDVLPYYEEGARAHDDALEAVLQACTADEACAVDAGGDALVAYDALAATLDAGPIEYDFPMPDGTVERRTFGASDLELAAAGTVNSLGDRMLLQRAVTAAADGNLVPLARLAYSSVYVDPETLEVDVDPAWSDATYYAVECQDYEFLPDAGTPRERLDAWLDEGAAAGIEDLRLGSIFYGDLPCLFWPEQPADVPRPAPIVDPPYPTLVLNADTDGPTPVVNAMRVFATDGGLVPRPARGRSPRHLRLGLHVRRRPRQRGDRDRRATEHSRHCVRGRRRRSVRRQSAAGRPGLRRPTRRSLDRCCPAHRHERVRVLGRSRRARGRLRPRRLARVRAHRRSGRTSS